jgi:hypothetical protein
MAYTNGKWEASLQKNGHYLIHCPKGLIADVFNNIEGVKGNAAIIAAAPRMLELLKKIREDYENGRDLLFENQNVNELTDVINEAKGWN